MLLLQQEGGRSEGSLHIKGNNQETQPRAVLLEIRALNPGTREGAETTDFLPVCDTN